MIGKQRKCLHYETCLQGLKHSWLLLIRNQVKNILALARVDHLLDRHPVNLQVTGLISGQSVCLG